MLPTHKKDVFELRNDEDLLNFMFSASSTLSNLAQDLTPADSNVAPLPVPENTIPIQTLETLRDESEALGINAENLTKIKLSELQAIYLAEPSLPQDSINQTIGNAGDANKTQFTAVKGPNDELIGLPKFQQSEAIFTQIIQKYPNYPSAYNNRAQLNQLLALYLTQYPEAFSILTGGVELTGGKAQIEKKIKFVQLQALSDLNQSIQLCYRLYPLFSPEGADNLLKMRNDEEMEFDRLEQEWNMAQKSTPTTSSDTTTTTPTTFTRPQSKLIVPRVLVQSLCQRALLHKLRGNELLSFSDFKQAAALGSKMAREEIDGMNVFEKLNRETVVKMMKQHTIELNETAGVYQGQIQHDKNTTAE